MPRGVQVYCYGVESYGDFRIIYRFRSRAERRAWVAEKPANRHEERAFICQVRRGHGHWGPIGGQCDGEKWMETG